MYKYDRAEHFPKTTGQSMLDCFAFANKDCSTLSPSPQDLSAITTNTRRKDKLSPCMCSIISLIRVSKYCRFRNFQVTFISRIFDS